MRLESKAHHKVSSRIITVFMHWCVHCCGYSMSAAVEKRVRIYYMFGIIKWHCWKIKCQKVLHINIVTENKRLNRCVHDVFTMSSWWIWSMPKKLLGLYWYNNSVYLIYILLNEKFACAYVLLAEKGLTLSFSELVVLNRVRSTNWQRLYLNKKEATTWWWWIICSLENKSQWIWWRWIGVSEWVWHTNKNP